MGPIPLERLHSTRIWLRNVCHKHRVHIGTVEHVRMVDDRARIAGKDAMHVGHTGHLLNYFVP